MMSLEEMDEVASDLYKTGVDGQENAHRDSEYDAEAHTHLLIATSTLHASLALKSAVEICRRLDVLTKLEETRFTQNELLIAELQMARQAGPLS